MTNKKMVNNKKNKKNSKKNVLSTSAVNNPDMTIAEYKRFQGTAQHAKELENLITLFEIEMSSDLFKALTGNPIDVSADINRYHIFLKAEAIGRIMAK